MSTKDILVDYFSQNLLTNCLSFTEFEKIVVESTDEVIHPDVVRRWYTKYQDEDQVAKDALSSRVQRFLRKLEKSELRKLETSQLQESFSLEEIVNTLYNVDQILGTRVKSVNSNIESNVKIIAEFNEVLMMANRSELDVNSNLKEILSTLQEYRSIVQSMEANKAD